MTRINSAIPVECLTDEHLLAEHREIKRLPYNLQQAIQSGSIKRIPEKFTLGKGHILFFLDKQEFITSRYLDIHNECKERKLNVQYYYFNWHNVSPEYFNDYTPTDEERQLLIERITERIKNSPKKSWHYYGNEISKDEAINLLDNKVYDNVQRRHL